MLAIATAHSALAQQDVSIEILSPATHAELPKRTLVVVGNVANAHSVTVAVDDNPASTGNIMLGSNWNAVIESGALTEGLHTLTATAIGETGTASDSISVNIFASENDNIKYVNYYSSVDNALIPALVYVPHAIDKAQIQEEAVPLGIHLHGGGGFGELDSALVDELEKRNWVGISPDGRDWGLDEQGCFPVSPSFAYVDSD